MIILRRALAIVLVVVFAVGLLFLVLARVADGSLLNPVFLKRQLNNSQVYSFALREAVPLELRDDSTLLRDLPLTAAEMVQLVQATVTEDYLKQQVEGAIDAIVPYAAGRTDQANLTIPLKERKRAFESALAALLIRKYDALPPCARVSDFRIESQFPKCRVGDSSGNLVPVLVKEYDSLSPCASPADLAFNPFPRCRAGSITPEVQALLAARYDALPACQRLEDVLTGDAFIRCNLGRVTPERLLQLMPIAQEIDQAVPDQLSVTTADITANAPSLDQVRQTISTARGLLVPAMVVLVLLLLAIAFLGGRSWRGRLRWGAAALVVGGLLLLLWAIGGRTGIARAIDEIAKEGTGFSTQIEDKAFQVIQSAVNSLAGTVELWAIVLLVVAGLGLVLSFVLPHQRQAPVVPPLPGTGKR